MADTPMHFLTGIGKMVKSKDTPYYILISIIISVFLLYYLSLNIKIDELILVLREVYIPFLTIYIVIHAIAIIVRAYRYKILIASERIDLWDLSLVTVIRNLFVDLLPARIGSLSYIYLIVRHLKFPFEIGASTFLICFVFDLISLGPILLISILRVGFSNINIPTYTLSIASVIFFLITLILILFLSEFIGIFLKFYNSVLNHFGKKDIKFLLYVREKLELTQRSIKDIKGRGIYLRVFLLSLVLRMLKYGGLYFILYALLLNRGYDLSDLSFYKFIIGITGAELSSNLPIHGFAGIGTWSAAWALTFHLLGFDKEIAIITGLGLHLITQAWEYILGISGIIILALQKVRTKCDQ